MSVVTIPQGLKNRNIMAFVLASPFSSIGNGLMWFAFSFLVASFSQGDKNTQLGRIGGIVAVITLASSFLGSYISDHYRRDIILDVGIIIGLIGFYLLTVANSLNSLLLAQSVISISWGVMGPAQNALIADSTKLEERNSIFGWMFVISNVFMAMGNIIGYFLFRSMGDTIDVGMLRLAVKISYLLVILASIIIIIMVRDKYVLQESEDVVLGADENNQLITGFTKKGLYAVTVMLIANVLIGMGAGFSIPFMQFFFVDQYGLSLSQLSLIFAFMMMFTGFLGKWLADLGTKHGRVKMIVSSQLISVILLYTLATYPPMYLAIIALLTRNAAMNAVGPLAQALLMDNTPRNKRSLINFINNFSWSLLNGFGQFLGGMLIDKYGYWIGFVMTATMYLISDLLISTIREDQTKTPAKEPLITQPTMPE